MRRRKKLIRSQDLRYLVAFAAVVTLVASSVAYGVLNPPRSEQFFAMWILGSGGLTEHYYPGDDPNLRVGEEVNWTLGIYNHMGSLQYVVVRVKLLNSTLASPDESSGRPSPVSPILEFTRVLVDNETWFVPFRWRIENVSTRGGDLVLTGLSVNTASFNGDLIAAISGFNCRFVFELWSFDLASDSLTFSGGADKVNHPVWTQIWFNATAPRLE